MSIKSKILDGAKWQAIFRLVFKIFSFAKIFIIARILEPKEYGVFAIATLVISAFEVLTYTGFDDALIHKKTSVANYLDTSYWIQVLRGILLFILVYFNSDIIASFFDSAESASVIRVLAITQLLIGFRSIGLTLLLRDLNFKKEIKFELLTKVVEISSIIVLTIIWKSVWGVVIGTILGELVRTIGSFFVHTFRPKLAFDIEKAKELYKFGIWLFLSGCLSYVSLQGDNAMIGKLAGVTMLGIYQVAFNLSNLTTREITSPLGKILKPTYAKFQDDLPKLIESFSKSFSLIMFAVLPISVYFIFNSEYIVILLLGDKWLDAIPFVAVLTIGGLFRAVGNTFRSFFIGTGNTKIIFKVEVVRAISMVVSMFIFFELYGAIGIAIGVCVSTFLMQFMILKGITDYLKSSRFLLQYSKPLLWAIFVSILLYLSLNNLVSLDFGLKVGISILIALFSVWLTLVIEKQVYKGRFYYTILSEIIFKIIKK
jgi:lipopolysaccharide exporter